MIILLLHLLAVNAALGRWSIVIRKIARVSSAFNLGNDRPLHFSVVQIIPIDGLEETMLLHKRSTTMLSLLDVTEALRRIYRT